MLEIHLVPKCCTPRGMQRLKIVEALAPSRTMAGPRTLTITARRLDVRQWEAWYVPIRFWQREPEIPRIEQHLCWRDELGESLYRYVRQTYIACDNSNPSRFALGPDVRVVGGDQLSNCRHERATQIGRMVRRLFYLRADDPGDGLTTNPDATCVSPRGHRSRCPELSEQAIEYGRRKSAEYLAELNAKANGLVRNGAGQWVAPEQFAAEQAYAAEQAAFERRARGG